VVSTPSLVQSACTSRPHETRLVSTSNSALSALDIASARLKHSEHVGVVGRGVDAELGAERVHLTPTQVQAGIMVQTVTPASQAWEMQYMAARPLHVPRWRLSCRSSAATRKAGEAATRYRYNPVPEIGFTVASELASSKTLVRCELASSS
jgi:hypothetical protein